MEVLEATVGDEYQCLGSRVTRCIGSEGLICSFLGAFHVLMAVQLHLARTK